MKRKQVCSWHEPKMDGYTAALCLCKDRYTEPKDIKVDVQQPWRDVIRVSANVVRRPAKQVEGGLDDKGRA